MDRKIFFCVVLLSILPSQFAHADVEVDLGTADTVTALFSYPNCQLKCTPTLEDTVKHYFTQSLQRDGFADSTVSVTKSANGHIVATFGGRAALDYPNQVTGVLKAGDAGLEAVKRLQADNKWRNDWRFFLPLGLAWVKHPTLEILIYPPDYTLENQDYLAADTTKRWSDLLVSQGLTREESDRYQDIIDIAPIAAPHDCMGVVGKKPCEGTLTDLPSYFHDYQFQLLRLWLSATEGNPKVPRPAVAFGRWVLLWLKQNPRFNIDLKVGEIGRMALPNGSVPVIGSNHPAYLYNFVSSDPDMKDKKRFKNAMAIMRQDAIVACWQIHMGEAPDGDAAAVLASCKSIWEDKTRDKEICRLLETEGYRKTPDEAKQDCESRKSENFVYPSDEDAAELAKQSPF